MTPRVVLADDHVPTRLVVRLALEDAGFEVVAEAGTAERAVAETRRLMPDIVLLDVRMPGGGIEAARAISASTSTVSIVMLTVSRDDDDLFAALQAGAMGYVLKDTARDRLPKALRAVLDGEAALPRSLVARVVHEFRERQLVLDRDREVAALLTSREWEVLERLRDGGTTATIAAELFLSPITVRTHVASVLHKLQVPSREAAVELVTRVVGKSSPDLAADDPRGAGRGVS